MLHRSSRQEASSRVVAVVSNSALDHKGYKGLQQAVQLAN